MMRSLKVKVLALLTLSLGGGVALLVVAAASNTSAATVAPSSAPFTVLSTTPAVDATGALPSALVSSLAAQGANVRQAHEVDLAGGYHAYVMSQQNVSAGVCLAFVPQTSAAGNLRSACGAQPGTQGGEIIGWPSSSGPWHVDGIAPDNAVQVRADLRNGGTVTVPVVNNVFALTATDWISKYEILASGGALISSDTLPGPDSSLGQVVVTSH